MNNALVERIAMKRILIPLLLCLLFPQQRFASSFVEVPQQERATNHAPTLGLDPQKYASGESHFLLGGAKLIDLAVTTDQPITICCSRYIIRRIVVTDASATPVLAAGGLYPAASKSGTALVGTGQLYTGLTSSSKYVDLTLASAVGTDINTATTLYLSLTVANAAAATVSVFIYGDALP